MSHYLIEVGYTPQSWQSQIEAQSNVIERITPAVKATNGKIECLYYAFGDTDLVGVIDWASPEDAAAFALAVTSSGALRSYKTTPLLSVEQGIESMRRAAAVSGKYTPPLSVDLVGQRTATKTS